jgi:nucleotide-binding universal stress UspA family protein
MDSILHDHSTVEGIVEHAEVIIGRLGIPLSARYVGGTQGGYPTIEIIDPRSDQEPLASVLATSVRTMIQDRGFEAWITDLDQGRSASPASAVPTIRHEIDPAVVSDTIAKAIAKKAEYGEMMRTSCVKERSTHQEAIAAGRKWAGRIPPTEAEVDAHIEAMAAKERDVYARVRIIEKVGDRSKARFFLVYGDQPDDLSGEKTGGFASLDLAREWFVNQGR